MLDVTDRQYRTASGGAVDIVLSDDVLRMAYLLGHAQSGLANLSEERAARFLLWFAVNGRDKYAHWIVSPDYYRFLCAPEPPYPSRLAAFIATGDPRIAARFGSDVEAFNAWYYTAGIALLRLGPFVSSRERAFLSASHPRFAREPAPLAAWQYYYWLGDPKLQQAFDISDEGGRAALAAGLVGHGSLFDSAPAADRSSGPGVNVIGFADNVMGIGEDVRALVRVLGHAGIPHSIVSVSLSEAHGTTATHGLEALQVKQPMFPINIFALPPFETARLCLERGPGLSAGRFSIGYWPWELNNIPEPWRGVFDLVDEIWAPSEFLADVYAGLTTKPVFHIAPYVNLPAPEAVRRESFGLNDSDFVFLTMLDFNSFPSRKNPAGAVAAFRRAFPSPGSEKLIIKTLNGHARPEALHELQDIIAGDDRCVLFDGPLTRPQTAGLISGADCLISLHRAEGLGRVIAEAMALGTPVVSTDWSGSTSLIDPTRGFPVAYRLRDVGPGEYLYRDGSQWAEPSPDDAAAQLRRVRTADTRSVTENARRFVLHGYGIEEAAKRLVERLDSISRHVPVGGDDLAS
jgi:glycosyltransferase involved in cell wall biosynthesis